MTKINMSDPMLKTFFKYIGAALTVLVALYFLMGGSAGLVNLWLPEFPQFPTAKSQLSADDQGVIYFQSSSPFDLDVLLSKQTAKTTTSYGSLYLPELASENQPVAVMVLVHGSSGLGTGREPVYVKMLNDQGIGAFVLDYYGSRGLTPDMHYMAKLFAVSEIDALSDAYHALALLKTHPTIDPKRIGLAGFSYGGMAIRLAMADRIQAAFNEDEGFDVFVDVYGPCFQVPNMLKTNGAPLLTLRGDNDGSNVLTDCKNRETEIQQAGSVVEAHIFKGAPHAWDMTDHAARMWPDSPYIANCEIIYTQDGKSTLNGKTLITLPLEAERSERVVARFLSQIDVMDCLQYGYMSGQDQDTMNKSTPIFLDFLKRYL